jgi:lipopolysaccharide/colanic/teichoic acid biosynthesis glycosyltransferase
MSRYRTLFQALDFALICVGFGLAIAVYAAVFPENYSNLTPGQVWTRFVISVVTFWVAARLYDGAASESLGTLILDQFCLGTGPNLILQAILNYLLVLTRSFFMIVAGGLFAAILLAFAKKWIYARFAIKSGVVIIGFDRVSRTVASSLRQPVLGVIGMTPSHVPAGLPFLGDIGCLEQIVAEHRPTQLVISKSWAQDLSPSVLLNYRVRGISVATAPALYEKLFHRVYCEDLEPAELLLSPALRADHRTMAIQAVYTNLIGILFLLALAPALALASIALALFSRPGPIFESVNCVGFQNIPFSLLRFRTRRMDGSGRLTVVGAMLARLHLTNVPQIINVIRGDMSLFGPRPVRREFARRLIALIPFYSLRFCVKPGIFGWAQMHLRRDPQNEFAQFEYDLYYIKEGSPLLDLGILIGTLFSPPKKVSAPIVWNTVPSAKAKGAKAKSSDL